jgi:hypothetical protein
VNVLPLASRPWKRRLGCLPLALVLCAGCSSSLDNRPPPRNETPAFVASAGKLRFPNPDIEAKYKAAKSSPRSFELVLDYGRSVVLFGLASLLDTTCSSCDGELPVYRPRSELNTAHWPVIEDALVMLDPFLEAPKQEAGQMDLLVEVKGRLLWLAGRSAEEQSLIDGYVLAHPTAIALVKRRLEILRDASDSYLSESQCSRSRARLRSAPEAERLDLMTSCVALHPNNPDAKSDTADYATYLPNLSPDEAALYRTHLVQRCAEDVGDEGERCAKDCACETKDAGRSPAATCKRACGTCRKETAQALLACRHLGDVAPDPVPARHARATGTDTADAP